MLFILELVILFALRKIIITDIVISNQGLLFSLLVCCIITFWLFLLILCCIEYVKLKSKECFRSKLSRPSRWLILGRNVLEKRWFLMGLIASINRKICNPWKLSSKILRNKMMSFHKKRRKRKGPKNSQLKMMIQITLTTGLKKRLFRECAKTTNFTTLKGRDTWVNFSKKQTKITN